MENQKYTCMECVSWTQGDYWASSGRPDVLIESEGWCHLGSTKCKKWSWHPVCKHFVKRPSRRKVFTEEEKKKIIEDGIKASKQLLELIKSRGKNKIKEH